MSAAPGTTAPALDAAADLRASTIAVVALATGLPRPIRNIILQYSIGPRATEPNSRVPSGATSSAPTTAPTPTPAPAVDIDQLVAKLLALLSRETINSAPTTHAASSAATKADVKTLSGVDFGVWIPERFALPATAAAALADAESYNLHPVNSRKHFDQEIAIASHLIHHFNGGGGGGGGHALNETTTIVDVGAGRGSLAYLLHSVTRCNVVLIDHNPEWKQLPNIADSVVPPNQFLRICEDIATVDLSAWAKQSPLLRAPNRVIVITKHLCGRATDDVLRVMFTSPPAASNPNADAKSAAPAAAAVSVLSALPVVGFAFAPCCHGKMIVSGVYDGGYIASEWLAESAAVTSAELEFMIAKSNWATLTVSTADPPPPLPNAPKVARRVLKAAAEDRIKKRIGLLFQSVLDLGRHRFMHARTARFGFACETFKFIAERVTPKNTLILCCKK